MGDTYEKNRVNSKVQRSNDGGSAIYNNPQITFKAETFITLSIIAWTYLLHAYYANKKIDFRYFHMNGKKKIYDRTKHGAYKYWELERCLDEKQSPINSITTQNLKFLIGLRHEIEHQMTKKIDSSVSAKLQACSINYNFYIKELFGDLFGVDQELGMVIQFSPIEAEQKESLLHNEKIADNVRNFITTFEDTLTDDEIGNTHYAYRVVFARIDGKRVNGETDEVIKFLPADSPQAQGLNAKYALIKELEKKKYLSKDIVNIMRSKGYDWFNVGEMKKNGYARFNTWWFNKFWEYELQIDKDNTDYGYYDKYHRFVWKESFLPFVREFCEKNATRLK